MKKEKLSLSEEQRAAVDEAISSVAERVSPEDRYDCRQDITLALLLRDEPPENTRDWLRGAAWKWVLAFEEETKIRKRTEKEYWVKTQKRYKKGPVWEPKWFPPCEGAEEYAPLACKGARMMRAAESK